MIFTIMKLRLDPWAVEYQSSFQPDDTSLEKADGVDLSVERDPEAWIPLNAISPAEPRAIVFLDGSRRIEARVILEDAGEDFVFGALGSYGVGAVVSESKVAAYLDAFQIERICTLSGGERHEDLSLPTAGMHSLGAMRYRVVSTNERDADAVVRRLQAEMRDAEAQLAARLATQYRDAFVICDGPRPLLASEPNLLGYIKTIYELKIGAEQLEVVRRLEEGQRSPVYLIGTGTPRYQRFEWFVRLRDPSPWLFSLAGMVRLQAFAGPEPEDRINAAVAAADWSCSVLPRFATRQHQDPRAPQQLLPVRALEEELRRRMGSPELIRRRITLFLSASGVTT
jgi:hypothetical protein